MQTKKSGNLWKNCPLHLCIFWASTALWRDPCDDLIGVFHVTGLAVHTVGKIEFQIGLPRLLINLHLVNIGRTEPLTRIPVFLFAFVVADMEILNLKMGRLLLLMGCSGIVDIRLFIMLG